MMNTRRREPLPVKGYKLIPNPSIRTGSSGTSLQEAARAAREVLLEPVVGALSYGAEVTRRYQTAREIVNRWLGLSHRERVALNRSLPWEGAAHLVGEAVKREAEASTRGVA